MQACVNHLFLSQRAARLLREFETENVFPQCVVNLAKSPMTSMVLIPCRIPFREGQSFILSMRRNSSTRLR